MANVSLKSTINAIIDWLQLRFEERGSWNGTTIIIISILALIVSPIIQYAAWFGLAYGGWLLWNNKSD
jgi:hypothetical protein